MEPRQKPHKHAPLPNSSWAHALHKNEVFRGSAHGQDPPVGQTGGCHPLPAQPRCLLPFNTEHAAAQINKY